LNQVFVILQVVEVEVEVVEEAVVEVVLKTLMVEVILDK
jgi:hypothetical protein